MKENSNEIWKDIKGYEGLYQVSNFGRVKSLNYNRTQNEKILKPGNDCLGYYRISLSKCGKAKTKAIELFDRFNILYLKDQLVSHLSGGEKQRIAILRSLITDCPIILADEPTGALDAHNKIIVMDMLKIVSLNHLVIMVSHDENLVSRYADKIICLAGGKIKEETSLKLLNFIKVR